MSSGEGGFIEDWIALLSRGRLRYILFSRPFLNFFHIAVDSFDLSINHFRMPKYLFLLTALMLDASPYHLTLTPNPNTYPSQLTLTPNPHTWVHKKCNILYSYKRLTNNIIWSSNCCLSHYRYFLVKIREIFFSIYDFQLRYHYCTNVFLWSFRCGQYVSKIYCLDSFV